MMLGLLLIYFIGKQFYELSLRYHKSKWLYTVLGIVIYYVGTIMFAFGLGIYAEYTGNYDIFELSDIVIGLMGIPFGLAACAGFYFLLKRSWSRVREVDTIDNWDV